MADLDKDTIRQFAHTDQLLEETVEYVRYWFSNSDDAGRIVGEAIREAAIQIARNNDHSQLVLRLLEIGSMVVLERVNQTPESD